MSEDRIGKCIGRLVVESQLMGTERVLMPGLGCCFRPGEVVRWGDMDLIVGLFEQNSSGFFLVFWCYF